MERNGGNANAEHLSCRHDDSKDDRTKLLDGVKDEQLSRRRGNGCDDVVAKCFWVRLEELVHNGQISGDDQAGSCNANSRHIHSQHHLVRIDIRTSVLGVHLILPLRCERIKRYVAEQEEKADQFRAGLAGG